MLASAELQAKMDKEDAEFERFAQQCLDDLQNPNLQGLAEPQDRYIVMEGFGRGVEGAPMQMENPAFSPVDVNASLSRGRVGELAQPTVQVPSRREQVQPQQRLLDRRQFFGRAATGTAAVALVSALPEDLFAAKKSESSTGAPESVHNRELTAEERTWAIAFIRGGIAKWRADKAAQLKPMGPAGLDGRSSFKMEMQWLMSKVLPKKYIRVFPDRVHKDSPWKEGGRLEKETGTTTEIFCLGVMRDGKLVPAEGDAAMWGSVSTDKDWEHPELNKVGFNISREPEKSVDSVISKVENVAKRAEVTYVASTAK